MPSFKLSETKYTEPLPFVPEVLLVEGVRGPVLDVGAGSGRNAIWLARQGFAVTAVDADGEAMAELAQYAKEHQLTIEVEVADIVGIDFVKYSPGIVLLTQVLHYLSDAQARELVWRAQVSAAAGVVQAIAVITDQGDFAALPKAKGRFYPSVEEVRSLYAEGEWEITYFAVEERIMQAKHEDGTSMKNLVAFMVVQKKK